MNPEALAQLLRLERPLVFLDLESTTPFEGAQPDPKRDRAIELAVLKVYPDGKVTQFSTYINPGIQITKSSREGEGGAYKGHGITDVMVADAPRFTDKFGRGVVVAMDDCDLAGYNARRYDFKLFVAECQRAGLHYDGEGVKVIDLYLLWTRMEPRDLAAFLKRFLAIEGYQGHNAPDDVAACVVGLPAILDAFPTLPRTVTELADLCWTQNPMYIDPDGKLQWRNGVATVCFGKHDTQDMQKVPVDYWHFLLRKPEGSTPQFIRLIEDAIRGIYPTADGTLPFDDPQADAAADQPDLFSDSNGPHA